MFKVDEIREIVNPGPLNRPSGAEAIPHWFQHRAFSPNLRVTIHADFCARDSRESPGFDRSVAVPAIDSIITDVMLMTELNRLRSSDVCLRSIGRPIHLCHDPDDPGQNKDSPEN